MKLLLKIEHGITVLEPPTQLPRLTHGTPVPRKKLSQISNVQAKRMFAFQYRSLTVMAYGKESVPHS